MKRFLGSCLVGLLFACGEAHIESVDDKTLDEATRLRQEADLKNGQTALFGTWTACLNLAEAQYLRYEYSFAGDGTFSVSKELKADAACSTDTAEFSEKFSLSGNYLLVPTAGRDDFHLQFNFDADKKIESQYQLKGADKGQFPKIVELKDAQGLALVELKDEANFIALTRQAPGEAEKYRQKAEQFLLNLGHSQLSRKGSWQSPCKESQQTKLEFKGETVFALTLTPMKFKDKDCKSLEETQPEAISYSITLDSIKDLDKGQIQISLKKGADGAAQKAFLKITEKALDVIAFSDFLDNSSNALIFTFFSTGSAQ